MRIAAEARNVSTHIPNQVQQFKIKASAKAFQVLTSNLYSNKVGAMIRELSANAADAHKRNGNADEPFEVHLPTAWTPELRIRDYGTGMSHETIMTLYTTIFDSDKNLSNDEIGGLGLGSKTPFSYVDTFTVRAYDNTTCRTYTAYLDEAGTPCITLINKSPNTGRQGIEILVPCQAAHISEFDKEARTYLDLYDPMPKITGNSTPIKPPEYAFKAKYFALSQFPHSNPILVMGPVRYKLDQYLLMRNIDPSDPDKHKLEAFLQINSLTLFGEIGLADIQPSREALSYDNKTIQNVLSLAKQAMNEFFDDLQKAISAAKDKNSAKKILAKVLNNTEYVSRRALEQLIKNGGLPYKNDTLKDYNTFHIYSPDITIIETWGNTRLVRAVESYENTKTWRAAQNRQVEEWNAYPSDVDDKNKAFQLSLPTSFFTNTATRLLLTYKAGLHSRHRKALHLLTSTDAVPALRASIDNLNVTVFMVEESHKRLLEKLRDLYEFAHEASLNDVTLPKIPRQKANKQHKKSTIRYFYMHPEDGFWRNTLGPPEDVLKGDKIVLHVPTYNGAISREGHYTSVQLARNVLQFIWPAKKIWLLGVPKSVTPPKGVPDAIEYLHDELDKLNKSTKEQRALENKLIMMKAASIIITTHKAWARLAETTALSKLNFMQPYIEISKKSIPDFNAFVRLINDIDPTWANDDVKNLLTKKLTSDKRVLAQVKRVEQLKADHPVTHKWLETTELTIPYMLKTTLKPIYNMIASDIFPR